MKARRTTWLLWLMMGLGCLSAWWVYTPKLAKRVNKDGLLALRVGMPETKIIELIGPPFSRKRSIGPNRIGEKPIWKGEWSWIYGKQGFFGLGKGFEISVGIKDGRMIAAGAERYDLGVWWCNDRGCPVVWNKEEFSKLPDP